ncbi:hypothetical protein NDU88_002182 [Pleurodeles waltl]|uniref:Uncharacterized protein n=1 Tax=Pleurodeles waltl TaxID=8319 RepID=A0AAV7WKI6_PLEWA|nr:hypothetical protein NDU88_002182 [Pleurodeles waltl]
MHGRGESRPGARACLFLESPTSGPVGGSLVLPAVPHHCGVLSHGISRVSLVMAGLAVPFSPTRTTTLLLLVRFSTHRLSPGEQGAHRHYGIALEGRGAMPADAGLPSSLLRHDDSAELVLWRGRHLSSRRSRREHADFSSVTGRILQALFLLWPAISRFRGCILLSAQGFCYCY